MAFIAYALLAAAAWLFAAAKYQNHGHAWADQTCNSLQSLCDSSSTILGGAAVAILLFVAMKLSKTG
jgi:hypothetical protein